MIVKSLLLQWPPFSAATKWIFYELGHGAFGTVYQDWDSNNGLVAIKKISRDEGRKAIEEAVKLQKLKVNLG